MMKSKWRLGLDVGTNSIGWCALELRYLEGSSEMKICGILDSGVRIFPDGIIPSKRKEGTSLAANRRTARHARRQRKRFLYRQKRLMRALIRYGMMPASNKKRKQLEKENPYALRAEGIAGKLELYKIGRALFQLAQHRGFKSNRKTNSKDDEGQIIKTGIKELEGRLKAEGFPTVGAFFHDQLKKGESVRNHFYHSRAMVEDEFDKIWKEQRKHHPQLLHEDAREKIHHHIFWQRKLKSKKEEIGRCTFETDEPRAPKALPLNQESRIRQEIANLKILPTDGSASKPLTREQQEKIFAKLQRQKTMTFNSIRKLLGLKKEDSFNFEEKKCKKLIGDETGTRLADKRCFDKAWWGFPPERQNEIVSKLLEEEDEEELLRVAQEEWELSEDAAENLVDVELPVGYGRLSEKVLNKIVPYLREGKDYTEAAEAAGYHHSQFPDGEIFDKLPYYGIPLERHVGFALDNKSYGKVANPTVHIALNQVRKVVNALIRRYGHPEEVIIEVARELKQTKKEREEYSKKQRENEKRNVKNQKEIQKLGVAVTGDSKLRMRLWEEQNGRCVYTGKQIDPFSSEVEIDHILPRSRTLDDSFANKVLSLRKANREKGNCSPHEAFQATPEWDAILRRSKDLPENKSWRFTEDAMKMFDDEKGFLNRQLNDTRHISKLALEYLGSICNNVRVIRGIHTAMLRRNWKLNSILGDSKNHKNRNDHRHHAIDAFVVAVTSRSMLQRIARVVDDQAQRDWLIEKIPLPYPGFKRDELKRSIGKIFVSHRPDDSVNGKLLDETAYSLIKDKSKWEDYNLVYRKPIESLNANEIERIRDPNLRREIKECAALYQNENDGLKRALKEISESKGIRRIRIIKKKHPVYLITHGAQEQFEKTYLSEGNHHIDILDTGGKGWVGVGVSMLDAYRNPNDEPWRKDYPGVRLVMRVHKGDVLRLQGEEGKERIYVVKKLNVRAKMLTLFEHNESGNLQKRHDNEDDPFRWLFLSISTMKEKRCRAVYVDCLGRVFNKRIKREHPKK